MYGIHILLVEDDERLREIVQKYLEHENFTVFLAESGEVAFEQLEIRPYHMVLLDVMLPDTDGWRILRHIRKNMDVPVIMLTARSEEDDKLFGFELGADDYVTKPFSTKLLLARIKAVLNRNKTALLKSEININNIRIQLELHQVSVNGQNIEMTPIEYSLLLYFADNINIALSRTQILNAVWGYDYYGDERTVDTHVKRLRQKLGSGSDYLETVRGHGYRLVEGKQ